MESVVSAVSNFELTQVVGNIWWLTLGMITFDVATGLLAAAKERKLNSSINYNGMIRKIGLFIAIAVGAFLDAFFSANGYITKMVVGLIVAYEGISIVENFSRIGIDLSFLTQYFDKTKVGQKKEKQNE